MYVSIRRYRLDPEHMEELLQRVDESFARSLQVRPGFASYEAVDCGSGELLTLSAFTDAEQAEASRDLARTWTENELADLPLELFEVLHGELIVNRAARSATRPAHSDTSTEFAELRSWVLPAGGSEDIAHRVAEGPAAELQELDGFLAFELADCGDELISFCLWSDPDGGLAAAERVASFIGGRDPGLGLEETGLIRGDVRVGRTRPRMIQPVGE